MSDIHEEENPSDIHLEEKNLPDIHLEEENPSDIHLEEENLPYIHPEEENPSDIPPIEKENLSDIHTLGVSNLHKRFGKKEVVRGVNFSIQNGVVAGLLGPN